MPFKPQPQRRTQNLRIGRVSIPGARYFLTVCTKDRAAVFTAEAEAQRVVSAIGELKKAGDIDLLAATVMPDHVHLLFALGSTRPLGQAMAKFKNLARDRGRTEWHWLDNGFEHRLRPDEPTENYGFYIFMNPYRARLIATTKLWPWWLCPDVSRFRFLALLNEDGTPPVEWIESIETISTALHTGE
jgi:REP element-mobilizing transposase RayT